MSHSPFVFFFIFLYFIPFTFLRNCCLSFLLSLLCSFALTNPLVLSVFFFPFIFFFIYLYFNPFTFLRNCCLSFLLSLVCSFALTNALVLSVFFFLLIFFFTHLYFTSAIFFEIVAYSSCWFVVSSSSGFNCVSSLPRLLYIFIIPSLQSFFLCVPYVHFYTFLPRYLFMSPAVDFPDESLLKYNIVRPAPLPHNSVLSV